MLGISTTSKSSILSKKANTLIKGITDKVAQIDSIASEIDAENEALTLRQKAIEQEKADLASSKTSILKLGENLKGLLQ